MQIVYTVYAQETLNERNISKEEVELALLVPLEVLAGKRGRSIAHRIVSNKLLRVVFETSDNTYIVITAYYTTISRYVK